MVRGRSCGMRRPLESKRLERGLYSGLARGIQELQKRRDALCPGHFIVLRAFDALVVQVVLQPPAFFEEHVTEALNFLRDARAFARADIQPDARAGLHDRGPSKTVDNELVPPDGRRESGDSSKNARMLEPQIEGNEAAQRRTADAGVLRAGERAVFAIDERLHFFKQKFCIAVGASAAEFGDVGGSVFANPRLGVVHPDDDQRGDRAGLNAMIRGLPDVPVLPGDEGSGAIEEILAIMKIKDGETAPGLAGVTGRRVNDEVALIAEKARGELFVFAELSGTHGAMVTRRSFAFTRWPGFSHRFTRRSKTGAEILEHMGPPPKAIANLSKELPLPQATPSRKTQQQSSIVAAVIELLPKLWRCVSSHTVHLDRQKSAEAPT